MTKKNITLALIATLAVGTAVVYFMRKNRDERRLIDIADAGYETAHDVLYPLKKGRWKRQQGYTGNL